MSNGDELRAVQRPIKDRYGEDPDAAQITLEAEGTLDDEIACSVQTGRAIVKAGLHPGTGGGGGAGPFRGHAPPGAGGGGRGGGGGGGPPPGGRRGGGLLHRG